MKNALNWFEIAAADIHPATPCYDTLVPVMSRPAPRQRLLVDASNGRGAAKEKTHEIHVDDEHPRRGALPDREVAAAGHQGPHRVHEDLQHQAPREGGARSGRGPVGSGPGEARPRRQGPT